MFEVWWGRADYLVMKWLSTATDNGRMESWDEVTYKKFEEFSEERKECGVRRMGIKAFFDNRIEEAGVLSRGTGKVWYENLVGGLRWMGEEELEEVRRRDTRKGEGPVFGFECASFVVDVQVYLPWYVISFYYWSNASFSSLVPDVEKKN